MKFQILDAEPYPRDAPGREIMQLMLMQLCNWITIYTAILTYALLNLLYVSFDADSLLLHAASCGQHAIGSTQLGCILFECGVVPKLVTSFPRRSFLEASEE